MIRAHPRMALESPGVRPKGRHYGAHPWGALRRLADWALRDGKLFYMFVGMSISAALFITGDVTPGRRAHSTDLEATAVRLAEAHR